jgi:hypothetical protein
MNVAECFCLKNRRDNFSVDPERDDAFFFGPPEWKQHIQKSFQKSILLNKPIRIVWWGDFGVGKTHRITYAMRYIRDNGLPFQSVFVVSSDITDRSGFDRLHFPMVNNLGATKMHGIVKSFVQKFDEGLTTIKSWSDLAHSEDVISAVKNLGNTNPPNCRAAWKWLTGLELSGKEKEPDQAGVTKEQIDSSVEFAEVLRALSLIVQHEKKHRLVYFIDQVERLGNLTNANAQHTWVETLRAILDMADIGIVLAIGASRLDQLPAVVLAPEVASRIGKEGYEHYRIDAYKDAQAEQFLKDMFKEWVDPAKRDPLVASEGWAAPDYDPEYYPFTVPAFKVFCRNVTHDPRDAKPRAFLEKLNIVAAEACMEDRRIIDKAFLLRLGFGD